MHEKRLFGIALDGPTMRIQFGWFDDVNNLVDFKPIVELTLPEALVLHNRLGVLLLTIHEVMSETVEGFCDETIH